MWTQKREIAKRIGKRKKIDIALTLEHKDGLRSSVTGQRSNFFLLLFFLPNQIGPTNLGRSWRWGALEGRQSAIAPRSPVRSSAETVWGHAWGWPLAIERSFFFLYRSGLELGVIWDKPIEDFGAIGSREHPCSCDQFLYALEEIAKNYFATSNFIGSMRSTYSVSWRTRIQPPVEERRRSKINPANTKSKMKMQKRTGILDSYRFDEKIREKMISD
jgi:hypothetical protein